VIITDFDIKSIPFYDLSLSNNRLDVSYQYQLNSPFAIFRWRGKSSQPGRHDHMFYSNPIKIQRAY